jgi:hypothetical protein
MTVVNDNTGLGYIIPMLHWQLLVLVSSNGLIWMFVSIVKRNHHSDFEFFIPSSISILSTFGVHKYYVQEIGVSSISPHGTGQHDYSTMSLVLQEPNRRNKQTILGLSHITPLRPMVCLW